MDLIGLYPTWYEPGIGSGWVIGIIATIHVFFHIRRLALLYCSPIWPI